MFAAHTAVAYATAQQREAVADTVATRKLIGRAEGILMERHRVTGEQAFTMLMRVSQHRNVKLRDIAERLVLSGRARQQTDQRLWSGSPKISWLAAASLGRVTYRR